MTDSPRASLPIDPEERPIEGKLLEIRSQLELLKQDKSCYVKGCDITRLYKATIEQVKALNEIRLRKDKRDELNRVDSLCDDCFQLISLGFMAIGKNNDAPAIYSVVSLIKRLLDHLKEAAFYSVKDLQSAGQNLADYRKCLQNGAAEYDPELLELIERRIAMCELNLAYLKGVVSQLTPELAESWERLVSILRRLSYLNTRSKYCPEEHDELNKEIEDQKAKLPHLVRDRTATIDEGYARYEDLIIASENAATASGEEIVGDLLERCILWSALIAANPLYVDPAFKELYKRLKTIRDNLDNRSLLQTWSLRETDLYDYLRQLNQIDESRQEDGNFLDAQGNKACLQTQRTLLYFLRKSYALIYLLLTSSQPVSEALLPIYNQLKTLKKCLREVQKAGGISSPRELYPYTMKLSSIDGMRVDGEFKVGNDIPDGQTAVKALLGECYDLLGQLKAQAEEDAEGAMKVDNSAPNTAEVH